MTQRPGPVFITGANSGFGLAAAIRFASRGWETWGTVRSKEKGDALSAEAQRRNVADKVHPLVLDVSDHSAVVEAWPSLPDFYAVVNNAGYSELGAIEEVSAAEARAQLDVNLIAPAVVASCALPAMRERRSGRIVMVSSIFGRAAVAPLNGWYHASKFGLEALSDVLRMEVAGFGVQVSIIEPGFFRTGIESRPREKAQALAAREDSPYRDAYARTAQAFESATRLAPPPSVVARAIVSAVESRRPLQRYLLGADALALTTAQLLLPRELIDGAARIVTGLAKPPATRRR